MPEFPPVIKIVCFLPSSEANDELCEGVVATAVVRPTMAASRTVSLLVGGGIFAASSDVFADALVANGDADDDGKVCFFRKDAVRKERHELRPPDTAKELAVNAVIVSARVVMYMRAF
mmetsp:Transcript_1921/g.6909  ORF Transcript_1921/g.6909 Transcript_1921/m.6909 type:complete len:118 (+) Transcript_1921:2172-2525(+)